MGTGSGAGCSGFWKISAFLTFPKRSETLKGLRTPPHTAERLRPAPVIWSGREPQVRVPPSASWQEGAPPVAGAEWRPHRGGRVVGHPARAGEAWGQTSPAGPAPGGLDFTGRVGVWLTRRANRSSPRNPAAQVWPARVSGRAHQPRPPPHHTQQPQEKPSSPPGALGDPRSPACPWHSQRAC